MLAGEDLEVQGSEESATGTAQPTVLMGDSLLALDQYVLLGPPNEMVTGDSQEHAVAALGHFSALHGVMLAG